MARIPIPCAAVTAHASSRTLRHAGLLLLALVPALAGCPAVNVPLGDVFGDGIGPPEAEAIGTRIQVAPGYEIGLYAVVPRAREILATPAGDVLVSVADTGEIVRLGADRDADGRPDTQGVLLEGLDRPNGMDLHQGWLYVAEGSAIGRVRYDVATGQTSGRFERIVEGLPNGGNHWRRTVRFGPDGWLYVTVGSSCNVCEESEPWRAAMLRFRPDGSEGRLYARGLRNSADFDWQPTTGALFATDNGRDLLGDDYPPCELDEIVDGGDYGWPVANGDRDPDPDYGEGQQARIEASLPPVFSFRPHNAPLGIQFLERPQPGDYRGAAIVALHGSWNRTEKDGYKFVSLHWDDDGRIVSRDFVWGFLVDDGVIGRPVDVTEGPDGTIYLSDDYAGVVYRVHARD